MDVFAHVLWTNAVFYKKYATEKAQRYWAVFFGVMPDLISFTPVTIYSLLFHPKWDMGSYVSSQSWIFVWGRESYNFTHSFISFVIVMGIVMLVRKGKMYWPLWGWALHIGIDIFSHKGFYETPLLYPLSHYKFDHGIPWAHPIFMLVNYALLALVYLVWFLVLRKKIR